MDNRIDQNRFLKILEKSSDKRYFYASLMFCKLAEQIWIEEIYEFTVLHGYSHIKQVINNQEDIFDKYTDEEILDILGEKFIFILLAATYSHDFGMKAYYSCVYNDLKEKVYDDLSFREKIKIRNIHSEIIDTALSEINNEKKITSFFGKSVLQYLDMILKNDYNLLHSIQRVILDNNRKVAIAAKYHNQPLNEFDDLISRLQNQRKLHLSAEEISKLKLVAAILQFSDALDMSISRVDNEKFLHSLKSIRELDFVNYQLINKSSKSYMIDQIKSGYVNGDGTNYRIEFIMSSSEQDLENHYDYLDSLKKDYERRLQRNDRDCLKIIESHLGFNTNIICSQQTIMSNENKASLPDVFFKIKNTDKKTMKNFLEEKLMSLSDKSILSFFKFFSNTANVFYGGYCYFPNKKLEQFDQMDIMIKTYLERIIFYPSDWSVDMKKDYDYTIIQDVDNFGLIDKKHIPDYSEYFRYYKPKSIKSEIHFPLKYRNLIIGFVKLHYNSLLNASELQSEIRELEMNLNTFGIEIQNIFQQKINNEYLQEISNAYYLSRESKETLKSLFNNLFEQYPDSLNEGRYTSISEIKNLINVKHKKKDDEIYFYTNKRILEDFINESNKYSTLGIGSAVWNINNDSSERLLCIDLKLSSRSITSFLVKREFLQASLYFEDDYPDEISRNYRITRYVVPLKCFTSSFGGKIYSELKDDNKTLHIKMIFPKYEVETLPNNV